MTLFELFALLRKHLALVIALPVVAGIAAFVISMCMPNEYTASTTMYVLSRDDAISPETLRMYANETLGLTEGKGYHVLLLEPMELSSTMIRETIRQGGDVSGYLTAPANAYLKEKGLYR